MIKPIDWTDFDNYNMILFCISLLFFYMGDRHFGNKHDLFTLCSNVTTLRAFYQSVQLVCMLSHPSTLSVEKSSK